MTGKPLVRHTPTLWNVAWSPLLFWDGRAASLEEQVRFPVEHPDEMGSTLDNAVDRFSRHESYVRAFAQAFPQSPQITPDTIAKALAAYERTLVSPPTRFDKWVAGDAAALTPSEVNGFAIFAGKGRCINCHTGFAFTDHGFYDIGLPSEDQGRGPIIGLRRGRPSPSRCRPCASWRGPRPTCTTARSARSMTWCASTRWAASRAPPAPRTCPTRSGSPTGSGTTSWPSCSAFRAIRRRSPRAKPGSTRPSPRARPRPADTAVVSQSNKLFSPAHVRLGSGRTLTILNDDTRTHNVRIYDKRFDYNSGAQEPHESVTIRFPAPGTYEAFCGIHPTMRLTIEVK